MITEEEANEWVHNNKEQHKWVTGKMLSDFANDKIREVVKQIHSQSIDKPIGPHWVGFTSYIKQSKDE
mgnify:FL=1